MKVIIFGATGKAGRCLVEAAINCNYQVTAFVRSKAKLLAILGEKATNIKIIEGNALDENAVAKAIQGHHALVNAAADAKILPSLNNEKPLNANDGIV